MKFLLLIVLTTLSLCSIAQDKELTLEDAVLGQWRQFYPTRLSNLSWRIDSDAITFRSDDGQQMMTQNIGPKASPKTLFNVEMLSTAIGEELSAMPFINWETAEQFTFTSKGQEYWITLKDGKLSRGKVLKMVRAENMDYHKASQQIAYTKENNLYIQTGKGEEIMVTQFEDPNIVSGQAIARYEFGIGKGTFWSPKGTYLAFYQKDETDVADYPLLDITTTPGSLRSIKYPMAGQKSEYAKVGIFNVKTKKTTYLKVKGSKDQYLTNLAWGPKGQFVYVAVVNREQNHVWLNKYNAESGDFIKTLFEEEHEKYVEPEHPVWFIPSNDNEFLWWSERDGFMHLHRYNVDGKYLGQVTKGRWVTLTILGLDNSGKNILVTGTDETGLNTTVYTTSLDGASASKRLVKTDGIHNFSLSSSGKYLIDNFSDIKTPHISRIVDLKGKGIVNLHTAKNPYEGYQMSTPELLTLKAKDGTPLQARIIKPANFDASKKYPVIVYVYGGPHAQMVKNSWLASASLWMYHAANKGYIVFTLDNRGSSNRGLAFENVIHRQLSKNEMEDQLLGVDYLKGLPYVNADKMAVHGWSYGGFMTTSLMLKHPDVFKVGVAGGPVTDWNYYEIMYGERYMDMPKENPKGYKETQLKNYVKNLKGDLLLIHGTIDDVVVMQHNLSLVKAFVDNGILVDFFPYPMHPHNVRGKDRVHLMNKVLTYIDEKLK